MEWARDVNDFVDANHKTLIQLCSNLVAAHSVNPPGRTVEAVAALRDFFSRFGIEQRILSNVEEKPNLVCHVDGRRAGHHLLFNGHLDTIGEGDSEQWSVPIFELTREQGRCFGIGMGNMKAAVAAMALAFVYLEQKRDLWEGRVSFTAVADETIFGVDGAEFLLNTQNDLLADAVICGEGPGDMQLAIAEKGLLWVRVDAIAPPGQGMLSTVGSSATTRLAKFINELDALNETLATVPNELEELLATEENHGLRLSVNIGKIMGGTFVSQRATTASAEVDFRIPPGMSVETIRQKLTEMIQDHSGISFVEIKGWDPNWTVLSSPVCQVVREAATVIRAKSPDPVVRLPASDASRWRRLGIPGVCFGPQPELASGIDDYANEQDIVDCAKIYGLAAIKYLAQPFGNYPDVQNRSRNKGEKT